jgi:Domain of unknown function (DUF5615)
LRPRFQADNDLRAAIRLGVLRREPSIDFQSARSAALDATKDPEVLLRAMAEGRILVSHDENSMPGYFREFLEASHQSPGLLIVPQSAPTKDVIESIILLWIASDAGEWLNTIVWLPL